ncbi:MAG TPA: hypothetical protein P5079_07110 [Elusimicrobiota bacterium]|nr:hypothetical protein [Elusimicrobiota bacterium]
MADIEELVRRHDQYQFEIKLGYDLNKNIRRDVYKVETFFFLPYNLDVNESTYSKKAFYRDLLLYIRFKTPDFPLSSLTNPDNPRSPLTKIAQKIDDALKSPTAAHWDSLGYEIKLLGCVLKSSLRDHINFIEKQFRRFGPGKEQRLELECAPLLNEYLLRTRTAAQSYRAFREKLKSTAVPAASYATYLFLDEYISLLIEGRTHQLLQFLYRAPTTACPKGTLEKLTDLIREEVDYRSGMGYPSVAKSEDDNEAFVYRLGILKKFAAGILHLDVRTTEEGYGLQQIALAIGAGIAMVFATSIAFYYQRAYGTLSLSFFVALVISYMFKDRLKAACQSYLQKILSKNLFDQSTDIYDQFNGEKIGLCRENFHFAKEAHLDPLAVRLRNRDHVTEIENEWRSEKIIHYAKEIVLFSRKLLKNQSRKTALTDILRFNVRNFLLKMDEPKTDLFVLEEGKSVVRQGVHVYNVNVVIKFTSGREVRYERFRLVLTRNGIRRIEPIGSEVVSAG